MHSNCNAPLDLSRFPPRSLFLGAHVRRVYIYAPRPWLLLAFIQTTKVSAFVRAELRHCLPVGKYYSNRMPRGVTTIIFSFATNPISDRIVSIVGFERSSRVRKKGRTKGIWKFAVVMSLLRGREGCLFRWREAIECWNYVIYNKNEFSIVIKTIKIVKRREEYMEDINCIIQQR